MANAVFFSNTAQQTTLSGSISAGATTITVGATTGFPPSFPYVLALDYGAATEELVSVTAAAGANLTITRAYGGTSAQSHSLGAVVRHVYDATEATAFRTHEAATTAVHGVAGTLVGTSDTQTLANKTLTSPTVNGGALSGTFTGTPTFTGGPSFTTASVLFSRAAATDIAARTRVTGDSQDRFQAQADGKLLWGPGNATQDAVLFRETANTLATTDTLLRIYRGSTSNNALAVRVTGDTQSRWFMNADGTMAWGAGGGSATDTNLYRSAADTLKTDDSFQVGANLTVTGNATVSGVGQVLFAYKTADTARATATHSDDPHLTVSVSANAVYEVEAFLSYITTDETNAGLDLDWTVPAGAAGKWIGLAQPLSPPTTGDGIVRTITTTIDAARNFGADSAQAIGMQVKALLVTAGSGGTYAVNWSRTGASGTLTLEQYSYMTLRRVA